MKRFLILASLGLLLPGCVSTETGRGSGEASNPAPTVVSISWQNQPLSGGASDIQVRVNGRDHFVARASTFKETSRAEYGSMGVPAKAVLAGIFWAEGAHEEDAEGVYAAVEGPNVIVYTGFYSPGDTENIEWRPKRVIPF